MSRDAGDWARHEFLEFFAQLPQAAVVMEACGSARSLCQESLSHSTRIEEIEVQLEALAKQVPIVARLRSVPGIALLTATAL